MAKQYDVNKLNDRDKRRLENIRDRLRSQGYGQDDATRRALEEITSQEHSGMGGGKAGGEAKNTSSSS